MPISAALRSRGAKLAGGKEGKSIMVRDMTIRVLIDDSSSARRQLFELEFAKFAIGRRCAARSNANRAAGCPPVDGPPVTARDSNATKLACAVAQLPHSYALNDTATGSRLTCQPGECVG